MNVRASPSCLRVAERILLGYFLYTSVLALLLPVAWTTSALALGANAVALGVLVGLPRLPGRSASVLVRNIVPLACVLLAYQQMGWFALPKETIAREEAWVRWDRLLLRDWGLQAGIEAAGPILPGVLELLYLLTYVLAPVSLLVLLANGRIGRADRVLAVYAASALAAYALFPYFPSEPPRTVFPGELAPSFDTVFRRLNWWLLGGAGIHTSVFPSGHVSSAFGAAFGLLFALPERKRYGCCMVAAACGIAVATVYGRYHYAVDAVAGLAASCAATWACLHWQGGRPGPSEPAPR